MSDEENGRIATDDDMRTADAVYVEINAIKVADSPRLNGENTEHTMALAECGAPLPPITVHHSTMCVIDGVHRLRAAELRGEAQIPVVFFKGDEEAAFVLAVEANIKHGMPLSIADRHAAAARILRHRPDWSDRRVAASTGLAPDTVGAVRRSTVEAGQLDARLGLDGRVRPLNSAPGRRRAADMIRARPRASLREIARSCGIAVGTARDVRERLQRGEDPVVRRPARRLAGARLEVADPHQDRAAPASRDPRTRLTILGRLRDDPTLRFSESGRQLLRWLLHHAIGVDDNTWVPDAVPAHCVELIVDLARDCAEAWQELAERLERRGGSAAMRTADSDGD
ncbi:MAG: hypothetical protein V7637_1954 [Mycobacteriales bacterium]|jgi:ParB-like chromosome segregation protein Spo0J